ncbi:MAG: hypothetical protein FWG39_04280 [Alphaproteobacteria bacterium]|nr:hypothetical protein [Alphaproteobacteria bacterium]
MILNLFWHVTKRMIKDTFRPERKDGEFSEDEMPKPYAYYMTEWFMRCTKTGAKLDRVHYPLGLQQVCANAECDEPKCGMNNRTKTLAYRIPEVAAYLKKAAENQH